MTNGGETPRRLIGWTIAAVAVALVAVSLLYLAREGLLVLDVSALFAIGLSPLVRALERRRLLLPAGPGVALFSLA